jgi:predicted kinase
MNYNFKTLWIFRGLPGAGKSSVAENLFVKEQIFEADKYFLDEQGNYNFDPTKLPLAHKWCQEQVEKEMKSELEESEGGTIISDIIVSNTSTTEKELEPYLELAKKYDYRVISLIVENRHGNSSVHNVPKEVMDKMRSRFSVKL